LVVQTLQLPCSENSPSFLSQTTIIKIPFYKLNRFLKSDTLALKDGLFQSTHLDNAPGVSGLFHDSPIFPWRLR
jgi:hypothetical protein